MELIAVGQSKGGVGKTTIAINLAAEAARHGRSVTVIDADPQQSALEWAEPRRLSFEVRAEPYTDSKSLLWVRNVLKTSSDFVIIDLPAGLGSVFETSVLITDLLVVPCGASSVDLGAAKKTIAKARELSSSDDPTRRFKIATVPTRIDAGTEEGRQIAEELSDLDEPVAPALSFDIRHARAFAEGCAFTDMKGNAAAIEEVRNLSSYLSKLVMRHPPLKVRVAAHRGTG